MTRIRAFFALVLAAAMPVSGCHFFDGGEPQLQRWGGVFSELRVQWSAEPGIELMTGSVVPLRAYVESTLLVMFAGSLDYAYPGFADAVPPNDPAGFLGAGSRRPDEGSPRKSALLGNYRYRVLSVQNSGRDVAITVCAYSYGVAEEQDNATFTSVGRTGIGASRGIDVERVLLVAPSIDAAQLPPQAGSAPAPSHNVFGSWQITRVLTFVHKSRSGFEALWPTYDADTQSCIDKAPDPPERRAFLIDGKHPRSDFPTSPADPGWP